MCFQTAAVQESKKNNPNVKLRRWLVSVCKMRVELFIVMMLSMIMVSNEVAMASGSCFMQRVVDVK